MVPSPPLLGVKTQTADAAGYCSACASFKPAPDSKANHALQQAHIAEATTVSEATTVAKAMPPSGIHKSKSIRREANSARRQGATWIPVRPSPAAALSTEHFGAVEQPVGVGIPAAAAQQQQRRSQFNHVRSACVA